MGYYLAPSLVQLRNEINTSNPNRDKASDGWIGDASHAARKSDHNPDYSDGGVVRAIDVDKDGIDPNLLVQVAINDSRVNYVIFDGHIWSRAYKFAKRVYTGANKHEKHVHISINHDKSSETDVKNWGFVASNAPVQTPPPAPAPQPVAPPFPLPNGYYFGPKSGPNNSISGYFGVGWRAKLSPWQAQMVHRGWKLSVDGLFGDETERVVRAFQKEKGLAVDGKIGPQTWAAAWHAPVT